MPVETFGYPDSLNASYPPTSDGLVGGDDHIRGIKATIKNTFPNLTGAVTGTQAQLNGATGWFTDGVTKLADAGVFFKTSGDGFVNTLAGDIDVKLSGVIAATFQRTGSTNFFKMTGAVQITGAVEATTLKGAGMAPIGGIMIWPSDTLPPSDEGTWAWCNGATYLKATYATCFARIGGSVSDTAFAVPNYQEVTLVGKSGMGGATAPGLLTSIASGIKTVLGSLFGTELVALTYDQLAAHYHTAGIWDPGHVHGTNANTGTSSSPGGGFAVGSNGGAAVFSATTGTRLNSANGLDTTSTAGAGQAHNNLQPSRVTNFIIRLA